MKRLLLLLFIIAVLVSPQPKVEASSPQVLATGTATLAATKLSLASTYAFFDMNSTAFGAYVGETIQICNTSAMSNCVEGTIGTVGTSETLSLEKLTNPSFDVDALNWSPWQATLASIAGGQSNNCLEMTRTTGSLSAAQGTTSAVTDCALYKTSFYVKSGSSGDGAYSQQVYVRPTLTGSPIWTDRGTGTSSGSWVLSGPFYTSCLQTNGFQPVKNNATEGTMLFDEASVKQVLTPSATGYWIRSKPGATDGDAWAAKGASFDPNSAGGFTWRIISSHNPSAQVASGTLTSSDVHLATVDGGSMVSFENFSFSDTSNEGMVKTLVPVAWWKADDLADGNGTAIATWVDKQGTYNATQATGDNQPKRITNCIGTRSCLRFDGVNDFLLNTTLNLNSINWTTVVVYNQNVAQTGYAALVKVGGEDWCYNGTNTYGILLNATTPTTFAIAHNSAGAAASANQTRGISYIGTGTASGSTSTVSVNGVVTTSTYSTTTISGTGNYIGSDHGGASFNYQGDISEIIIFNRALNDSERQQVERYLSTYYGIALTGPNDVPTSFAGSDAYTPPTDGLQLWLKADAGCYSDNVTTPCVADSPVYQWTDQSGNGNNATQTTAGYRPLYKTNVVGTLPAMRFDGSDDMLSTVTNPLHGTTTSTIYIVAKQNAGTSFLPIIDSLVSSDKIYGFSFGASGTYNSYAINPYSSAMRNSSSASVENMLWSVSPNRFPQGVVHLSSSVWTDGATFPANIRDNGVYSQLVPWSESITPRRTISWPTVDPGLGIGKGISYNTALWSGDIYEILIYNTAHDDITRSRIERYLAGKWNIAYNPTVPAVPPAKYLLCLYDSSSRAGCGYVGAGGGGEALAANGVTNGTFSADTDWTGTGGAITIHDGIVDFNNTGAGIYQNFPAGIANGQLWKTSIDVVSRSAGAAQLIWGDKSLTPHNSVNTFVQYVTTNGGFYIYLYASGASTFTADNYIAQRVTDIAATGVHLHSTPNATDRKMNRVTSGFDPNAVTSYKLYRVY